MPVRRRVLLIDDNVDAAESLKDLLLMEQYEVAVAHTGPDGVASAQSFRPDVILCDIGLPGMDGFEVACRIRADPTVQGVLLVALSGSLLPGDDVRAIEVGFDRCMARPTTIQGVRNLIALIQTL